MSHMGSCADLYDAATAKASAANSFFWITVHALRYPRTTQHPATHRTMKRHLALIALLLVAAQAALGQNPRWRFTLPAPTQPNTALQSVTVLANDGSGGAVFLITESREAFEITGGAYAAVADRIIWLD